MKLKFIGKDGSCGLRHGEVYEVGIYCLPSEKSIRVIWIVGDRMKTCPYSSHAAFAENWEHVKEN